LNDVSPTKQDISCFTVQIARPMRFFTFGQQSERPSKFVHFSWVKSLPMFEHSPRSSDRSADPPLEQSDFCIGFVKTDDSEIVNARARTLYHHEIERKLCKQLPGDSFTSRWKLVSGARRPIRSVMKDVRAVLMSTLLIGKHRQLFMGKPPPSKLAKLFLRLSKNRLTIQIGYFRVPQSLIDSDSF
jgi:hypothetical protein